MRAGLHWTSLDMVGHAEILAGNAKSPYQSKVRGFFVGVARKTVDWEAMEPDWRANIKPVLQLSKEYNVSRAAIVKHWRNEGIERDLSEKIRAGAEAKVTQDVVTHLVTPETKASEKQLIEANAEMMARVIRGHRQSLGRLGNVVQLLFDRLEAELTCTELFEQLGELMHAPDENGQDRLNDLYRKVIALPSQTDTAKKLAETLKTKIELERKVFKIEEQPPINPALSCMSVEFVNPPAYQDDE